MMAMTSIWIALHGDAADHQSGVETTSVPEDFAARAPRDLVLRCRRSKIAHGPKIGHRRERYRSGGGVRWTPAASHALHHVPKPSCGCARLADGYYTSIDMPSALHPQTIMAFTFADQVLPRKFGYPMRIRIPTKLGFPRYPISTNTLISLVDIADA
jgi:hypothetical protein